MTSGAVAFALPMKPDMKVLLDEAKRPPRRYIPARAGWNGPEEKSGAVVPNPVYDELRREPSPAEIRQQMLAVAVPDWRVLLVLGVLISFSRLALRSKRQRSLAPVV